MHAMFEGIPESSCPRNATPFRYSIVPLTSCSLHPAPIIRASGHLPSSIACVSWGSALVCFVVPRLLIRYLSAEGSAVDSRAFHQDHESYATRPVPIHLRVRHQHKDKPNRRFPPSSAVSFFIIEQVGPLGKIPFVFGFLLLLLLNAKNITKIARPTRFPFKSLWSSFSATLFPPLSQLSSITCRELASRSGGTCAGIARSGSSTWRLNGISLQRI